MYAASIRRLLELCPAGASQEQLLWRLKASGVRTTSIDILQSLNELSANGEIRIVAEGRWVLSRFLAPEPFGAATSGAVSDESPAFLRCVWGKCERLPQTFDATGGIDNDKQDWRLQDFWRQVISYYAASLSGKEARMQKTDAIRRSSGVSRATAPSQLTFIAAPHGAELRTSFHVRTQAVWLCSHRPPF